MMDLDEFRRDLLNQVHARASVDGVFTRDAFMAEASELLVDAGELDNLDLFSFSGSGRKRQSLAVNAFQFDEQDLSVSLVVAHFDGGKSVHSLKQSEASSHLRSLEQFLREAVSGEFVIDREPAMPEYQLAKTLATLAHRRGDQAVSRYRLYLVSDAQLSTRAKILPSGEIGDTPIEFHVWDAPRFYQVQQSQRGREPLELVLSEWGVPGVSALRVADSASDLTIYLAAIPGGLLAGLYRQHGSRLLEGNVRSFLTTRGKINRGIRETIANDPGHFLAYNNGISATASEVHFSDGVMSRITDLQIVNGGQTTASLFYASQGNNELDLDSVFVPMKLVVVDPIGAREMIPLISRYANSQNAVREDDFFSNSPFHVRMEELSKRLLVPARPGVTFQSKWYYERTRGQYLNEQNRRSAAEQKKFAAEFPRSQVLTKTDAAKYEVTWGQQPHQVSAGAQKNFKAYASLVADKFAAQSDAFNENYYKRLVAKAILFNSVRSAIAKSDWYTPGYLANLTAYSVAKLALEVGRDPRAASFDLIRIWEAQAVGTATLDQAVLFAKAALDVLTGPDRLVVNVTEWAKRESAWKRIAGLTLALNDDFLREWIPVRLNVAGKPMVTVISRFPDEVSDRTHVQAIVDESWRSIQRFLGSSALLTNSDVRLLADALSHSRRLFDSGVCRELLKLYVKALNSGWTEGSAAELRLDHHR